MPICNELPSSWWSPKIRLHLLLRARITDSEQDHMRIHLAELEYLVRDVDIERYNELFNNDELCA
jgi:hypothetical protein